MDLQELTKVLIVLPGFELVIIQRHKFTGSPDQHCKTEMVLSCVNDQCTLVILKCSGTLGLYLESRVQLLDLFDAIIQFLYG